MTVLADTTVLSNFAHVRRPDLLRTAFPDLAAPQTVVAEIEAGERLRLVPVCDWRWLSVLLWTESEQMRAEILESQLGAGEAACLALAASRGLLLLTDDRDARRVANTLALSVSGTLGVLARLVQRAEVTLEEADQLLTEMRSCGYRSPVPSLGQLLERF